MGDANDAGLVTWWRSRFERFFDAVRKPQNDFMEPDDFRPIVISKCMRGLAKG